MPTRSDFDPAELRPWLGRLLLLDVIDGGADFLYRLHGTLLVEMFGADLTGRRLSGLDYRVDRLWEEYRLAVRQRRPVCICGKLLAEKAYRRIDKLVLPLAADGLAVDRLLVGIMPVACPSQEAFLARLRRPAAV